MEIDIDVDASPSPQPAPPQSSTLTPAQRIADLNAIDQSVSTLLSSAATATAILSNQPSSSSSPPTLTSTKDQFTQAAHLYFSTLSSIEVRLRRQIYALEEAGLIGAGDERDARRGRTLTADDGSLTRRGGVGGHLDPSWLNARASESVERGKKREVLDRGKELVDKMNQKHDADVDMDG